MNVQASFTNFEYEQGSGPSNSQSFAINYEGLTDAIQINTVAPVSAMEFSLDSVGWSASLDTANTYSGTGTLTAYTRLKSGLSSSLYNGQFYVSFPQDGDAIPVNYNAAVKVPQQNVTIAGFYHPLRTFFGYPSASQYVSNPQEIVVNVKNPTFTSMSIVVTSSYQLCVDRDPNTPFFFTSSVSQSIITASGITNDYSLRFWMRLRSGSAGSVDTTLTVLDENSNTLATASIVGRRYTGLSAIDCWNEATTVDMLWRNVGTNANTLVSTLKHPYSANPSFDFIEYLRDGFINMEEWNLYFNREITAQQRMHVRLITPTTTFTAVSPPEFASFPISSVFQFNNTVVPTSPEFIRIQMQVLEPELVYQYTLNQFLGTANVNGFVSVTGLSQFKYMAFAFLRGTSIATADLQTQRFYGSLQGSSTITDTNGFLDAIKLPDKVGRITVNAARGGKKNPYYYPKIYFRSDLSPSSSVTYINTTYEDRNMWLGRNIDNIPQDGFIDANTIQITLNNLPLPEISDLSIYPNLQNLTLANLTGSLTTLTLPQTLTTLTISGSPVSYSINQEVPYSGALNTFNLFQSGSTNILNYDTFISNLRFTTSSQFTLTGAPTSSLPAIPSAVTASVAGGGPFDEINIRTFYTPGEPTMSILNVNGAGMTYTPNISMSFDASVSDLKTVNITNLTSSYDIDLSNLVSASINVVSGARNITLPITYANDNQTITVDSRNLENVYVPINANYSGSRNTTLGLIPGFAVDTLDLSGSFITNLTVSSSGYFNSFRRLLGGFETIRNYNFQFSSFDAGGVEYFLSQVSASNINISDYATGGTTGSLVDSTKNWIPNAYVNSTITIIDNSGNSYRDFVISNTTSSVSFGRMVAGGAGIADSLAYSNDGGLTWIKLGNTIINNFIRKVAWNGRLFIAAGRGTVNNLAYSNNGINWTGLGVSLSDDHYTVYWTGDRWLLGCSSTPTNNTMYYSYDGISWTGMGKAGSGASPFFNECMCFASNGSRILAGGVGVNAMAYSDDGGATWTGLGALGFSAGWGVRGISWNGTRFVAVGGHPSSTYTIAHSTDGITWTGLGKTIFSTQGFDVAWNGTRFVAVGFGTNTIAWSNNGIAWNGLGTSIFSNAGFSVSWNGTRFVAAGNSTNTLAHSNDGITWVGLGTSTFDSDGLSIASTSPFVSLVPNIGIVPSASFYYAVDKIIDLRNQRNGLQITTAISSSKATLEGLGWTVNL